MDFPNFSLDTSFLEEGDKPDPDVVYELLILGGGPAAMSAAIYAARKLLKTAIVTEDFGGQVRETSAIENWLGFQSINAKDLVDMFEEHVKSFSIPVSLKQRVAEVRKEGELFVVSTLEGQSFRGHSSIVATGNRHRPLKVPGEKEFIGKGISYCATCDAPFFKEKKVAVVGGANSAFTAALDLLKVGAEVILINLIEGWQADEVLQKRLSDYGAKAAFLDYHKVVKIEGRDRVNAVMVENRRNEAQKRLEVDGVFESIGLLPNSEPVRNLVELNERGEVVVDCACRTNVAGLFGAGDVTTVPHKQIVIAAGEGAKAALSAYNYLVDRAIA